ncbi:unnamed protein product [Oikopleura dioica]|uniref:Uncharacterized protein n=1 Tax=Oikopleura dioica TaxID=34765 RepID=E4XPI0_OIKDI|nr:unnamed protein product [Oikopleura dioica]
MSMNIDDSWISRGTSTTASLNAIKKDEELTKGWKKGEIALPHEFKDLDAVHILPLVDLGRLLVVLVTRSIELSNMQYSLLLENEGELLNLGSEWIGARVKYQKKANCFSNMLADDFEYTLYWGRNKDECEYFINAFVSKDRIYLQSYVFDTTFELQMEFEHIEVRYNQLDENNKLHVTSNPYFAYHDDVFPSYVKNQFTQKLFSRHAENKITIIPDNYFISLAFINHISTVLLDSRGAYILSFVVKIDNEILSSANILELKFSGGENLLSVELFSDGSIQYTSIFLEDKIIEHKDMSNVEINFMIRLDFDKSLITINNDDTKEQKERNYKFDISITDKNNKGVRFYKYDRKTAIKNIVIYKDEKSEDYLLLIIQKTGVGHRRIGEYLVVSGDLSSIEKATLFDPQSSFGGLHAVFKGRNYFFGSSEISQDVCIFCHFFLFID